MPAFVTAYLGSAAAMLVMDIIWLTTMVPLIYRPALGDMLADPPNLWVAAVFYLVYVVGVVVFAVLPALNQQNWLIALGAGALLGLVAYGTYDFTNLATLKNWPVSLSLIDVCWGIFLTASTATAGYFVANWLSPAN
ncbi:MAG: DUF2177 family protein [Devosia sp.]|nr:DUF2177 family protein [Devosia sp.]